MIRSVRTCARGGISNGLFPADRQSNALRFGAKDEASMRLSGSTLFTSST